MKMRTLSDAESTWTENTGFWRTVAIFVLAVRLWRSGDTPDDDDPWNVDVLLRVYELDSEHSVHWQLKVMSAVIVGKFPIIV